MSGALLTAVLLAVGLLSLLVGWAIGGRERQQVDTLPTLSPGTVVTFRSYSRKAKMVVMGVHVTAPGGRITAELQDYESFVKENQWTR